MEGWLLPVTRTMVASGQIFGTSNVGLLVVLNDGMLFSQSAGFGVPSQSGSWAGHMVVLSRIPGPGSKARWLCQLQQESGSCISL